MPGDNCLHATRQILDDKIRAPTRRVEIVKHVRTVVFNLRLQDFTKRCTRVQAMLSRPNSLNVSIIAIGEKCPFGTLINGQKDMSCRLSEIQKRVYLTGECRTVLGQLANLGAKRRIVSGILEEPQSLVSHDRQRIW